MVVAVISVALAGGALYYARKSSKTGQSSVEVAEQSVEISDRALATSEERFRIARDETERSIAIEQDPVLLSVASAAEGLLFFISNTGAKSRSKTCGYGLRMTLEVAATP